MAVLMDSSAITFFRAIPILRIFDEKKAREFYCDFLGFKVDWEHRFDERAPLYFQVSRGNLRLHLSEHHGDGSPGIQVHVHMKGIEEFHREVASKDYGFYRPALEDAFWGARIMKVRDPFHNFLIFNEYPESTE